MTEIKIENGKVFINGEETTNPELIGLAMLDLAEEVFADANMIENIYIQVEQFHKIIQPESKFKKGTPKQSKTVVVGFTEDKDPIYGKE